jgi:hypothetical protein
MNLHGADRAGFARPADVAVVSSAIGQQHRRKESGDGYLTNERNACTNPYMTAKRKTYQTLTEALLDVIADSQLSFKALERETGVTRQSLMRFAYGESSLRLDLADKLVEFFGIEIARQNVK